MLSLTIFHRQLDVDRRESPERILEPASAIRQRKCVCGIINVFISDQQFL